MIDTIVVLDTETTGKDPEAGDKVLELATVTLALGATKGWIMTTSYAECFIEYEGEIPPEARAVHHISPEQVRPGAENCYPYEQVIQSALDQEEPGLLYAAHNAAFDARFLPELTRPFICTWRCALHLFPDAPRHSNQVLRYFLGLEPDLRLMEGLAPHRALYDTAVTATLLLKMLETHDADTLLKLSTTPVLLRVCPFGKHRNQPWAEIPKSYLNWMLREGVQADNIDVQHTIRYYLN